MIPEAFEARLRAGEYFHDLKFWPGAWSVVRCDGRSFSAYTGKHFEKPFDVRFHQHMVAATEALLVDLGGVYAFTQSDELSVLLPPDWAGFGREWEKVVSLSAGIVSSAFTQASGHRTNFDARIWLGTSLEDVEDYFRWRQSDGERCALNGWCYWTLRKQGLAASRATSVLNGLDQEAKLALLREHNIDFGAVPMWQRRGAGLYWEVYEKEGYDPKRGQAVTARRRRIAVNKELPGGEAYGTFVRALCSTAPTS
jgi:tRNA(His) 5'-end guanylyltransferase